MESSLDQMCMDPITLYFTLVKSTEKWVPANEIHCEQKNLFNGICSKESIIMTLIETLNEHMSKILFISII